MCLARNVRAGILGPLELHRDGRMVPLGGPRQRALFALLAVHANDVVSRDILIDGLWGERPPATARRSLESYVSRLRAVLGADRLERREPGYILRLGPGELDLAEFDHLVMEGREQLRDDDFSAAAATLARALACWRGTALADVLYEPFGAVESARLEERRLVALEDYNDARLGAGADAELVDELEPLVAEHPFRERLTAQLMLALYRAGRQTEALELYRTTRARFSDELGLEPSPALRELERKILAHEAALARPAAPRSPARVVRRLQPRSLAVVAALAAALVSVGVGIVLGTRGTNASPGRPGESELLRLGSREVAMSAPLGASPAALTAGDGALWIADAASNRLVKADLAGGHVTDRIPLTVQPGALSVGDGAVWVAGTSGGDILRVDPATDQVTQTLHLPAAVDGLCACAGAIWATDVVDRDLIRVDPETGSTRRLTLPWQPSAISSGDGSIWVAGYDAGSLAQVDPRSDTLLGTDHVGQGPAALAYGLGALWVANELDGTVSRVDPATGRVTTVATGSEPTALAIGRRRVWVANELSSTISRIDPSGRVRQIHVGGDPTAVAAAGNAIWAGTAPATSRHGGTLVMLDSRRFLSFDPQVDAETPPAQYLGLVYDTLIAYNHVSGVDGLKLVPDLALALPQPTDSGLTYILRLRPGRRYSDGRPVRAGDFVRGMVRMFRLQSPYASVFDTLRGAPACEAKPAACTLARGVVADDAARTVTFHLAAPDPDFLFKLATGAAVPVPRGAPMHDFRTHPFPGTGPYRFGSIAAHELTFIRNPGFHEWSHAAQPDGQPDRLVWRFGGTSAAEVRSVIAGRADWTGDLPDDLSTVASRHPLQIHNNPFPTDIFVQLNTTVPPFTSLLARRALNFAIDRSVLVRDLGGSIVNTPSCQMIPPGIPGYRRYCPYTVDPTADGAWKGPDLARARGDVARSGTHGDRVTVWDISDTGSPEQAATYLVQVLRALGYRAGVHVATTEQIDRAPPALHERIQLIPIGFGPDYPSAAEIYGTFIACNGPFTWHRFCDPDLDREAAAAESLRWNDPKRSAALWSSIDRTLVDRAVWLPLTSQRIADVVSPRLRNYVFSPVYHFLPAEAWTG
jgi:ABC-type transport system substrate-binding protein/DNA-binding SARP family transcriptional activator